MGWFVTQQRVTNSLPFEVTYVSKVHSPTCCFMTLSHLLLAECHRLTLLLTMRQFLERVLHCTRV